VAGAPAAGYFAYQVQAGETWPDLTRFGVTAEAIQTYNHRSAAPLLAGEWLIIPVAGAGEIAPALIERGNTAQPRVAITLDAGAGSAPTGRMLDALAERNIRITFFLTGKWMQQNPDLTRRIVADGHELANHSFNHGDFRDLDDMTLRFELDSTEEAARNISGASTRPFFRPPYGAYDKRVLQQVIGAGYLPIYWTLDSLDSVGEPKTADFLFRRVTERLAGDAANGAIVLMHCGSEPSADALPLILDHFAARGVRVVPVSEALGP